MNARKAALAELLAELEQLMGALGIWAAQPPSPEALQSCEPFCVDTLSFPEWLQFVCIPKLASLCRQPAPLGVFAGSHIAAMAEVYIGGVPAQSADQNPLLGEFVACIARLDAIVSDK
ncbi:YqcC family protein [Simiduia sp. 21SJ11W-1]|uniref:YqcC family protein n=1 Tax=Simiduia sp. 21SJ11W-1 TaxID=2909669 RepID=UPI00209E2BD4|nr:YqcC family protein [Simiduia sp. 21SJ11W-1]UTA46819.1 YqcC family protein [Simiduia sp. 21SJ11W-1]